jgi:triosephosphate isomerase
MAARRKLIAGNWKMNGLKQDGVALAHDLVRRALAAEREANEHLRCDLLLCPPATLLVPVAETVASSPILLGGQDCHPKEKGAHTGDISAPMLKDAGCSHVILGHSERRTDHGESDALVSAKTEAARRAGLVSIVCVGETETERDAGRTLDVVGRQVRGSFPDGMTARDLVIAYEPVWAIGTGRTPTTADIAAVHAHIRRLLAERMGTAEGNAVRILYGGSVKASNAAEILAMDNVDGALVGGASLVAADFWAIARACK